MSPIVAVLLLGLGSWAAGRRNSKLDDSVPSIVSSLHSLLEQHEVAMAHLSSETLATVRTNLQVALQTLAQETPGVTSELTDVLGLLNTQVLEKIEADHNATQKRVNDDVQFLAQQANSTKRAKQHANQADAAWMTCVEEEKLKVQDVVDAQNVYNALVLQAQEECQEEVVASVIMIPSSILSFDVTCKANDDPGCINTESRLEIKLEELKKAMLGQLSTGEQAHAAAKQECENATKAHQDQLQVVQNAQMALNNKRGECKGKLNTRANQICALGAHMQGACSAKATYDELLVDVAGTGSPYSISDRKEEWHVSQMVMCLLRRFVDGKNITDAAVEECEHNISMDMFHIENKSAEVAEILNVTSMPDFIMECRDHAVRFEGGIMHHPNTTSQGAVLGYDGHVNSTENSSLLSYYFVPEWSSTFHLGNVDAPFEQCSGKQTCMEAVFDCGKKMRIDDAVCTGDPCLEEECCSDEDA